MNRSLVRMMVRLQVQHNVTFYSCIIALREFRNRHRPHDRGTNQRQKFPILSVLTECIALSFVVVKVDFGHYVSTRTHSSIIVRG